MNKSQIFTIYDRGIPRKRQITGELFQYGQRIYSLVDVDTKEEHTAHADTFDRMFVGKKGPVSPKGYKGANIQHKQKVY